MIREDYVMRLVRQFAEFLARVSGLRKNGDLEAALDASRRYQTDLLELPPGLGEAVDTPTLASLLRRPDKIRAAAFLFWEEGHIYKAKRDPLTAFARYRRALELFLEARALDPCEDDESAILELSRQVPAEDLAPPYRS